MTDFAPLLAADRGQKGPPDPPRRQEQLRAPGSRRRPAEDRALLEAHRFDGKTGYRLRRCCRAATSSRWSARSRTPRSCRPGASPSSPRACPRAPTSWPTGEPGNAALGWLLAQHRFDAYRSKKDEPEPRAARAAHRRAGADRPDRAPRRGDRAGPRPGQHAGRRPRPGRDRAGRARRGQAARARRCGSRPATSSAKGYPLIAAVGAAPRPRARAAADRARMGQAGRPAHRDRRQGRVLRQRRARPQVGRRHAADEEGHGRRGACARARPADHRRASCRSGCIC